MRGFRCRCGQRAFFENTRCLACERLLAFDPEVLQMVACRESGNGCIREDGVPVRHCRNRLEHGSCNWLVSGDSDRALCLSCDLNDMIPDLSRPGNIELWRQIEAAKRRLVYTLLLLRLPLSRGADQGTLRFRFLEDRRRNPTVHEDWVPTGHLDGVVTINLAEADDVARTEARRALQERYRTVLGHLRHEAGHYYFGYLTQDDDALGQVRALFGDERTPYDEALRAYYAHGPKADWPEGHLSAYASAHPHEDFAETFAHYLHIRDALETAACEGLVEAKGSWASEEGPEPEDWVDRWTSLAIALNEVSRCLGTEDPYPFVLSTRVIAKLRLMHHLVRRRA